MQKAIKISLEQLFNTIKMPADWNCMFHAVQLEERKVMGKGCSRAALGSTLRNAAVARVRCLCNLRRALVAD
eukprot:3941831-Rhodomonas_salina.2